MKGLFNDSYDEASIYIAAVLGRERIFRMVWNDDLVTRADDQSLKYALQGGSVEILETILKEDSSLVKRYKRRNRTSALAAAAGHGNSDVVRYLLSIGDGPTNHVDKDNQTPIFKALESDDLDTVQALLEHRKIDVNCTSIRRVETTPLEHAVNVACSGEVVSALLAHPKIDPNIKNKYGRTPLHEGFTQAYYQRMQIAEVLFPHDSVDKNTVDDSGRTPWQEAVRSSVEMLEMFLPYVHRNKIWHSDNDGKTALENSAVFVRPTVAARPIAPDLGITKETVKEALEGAKKSLDTYEERWDPRARETQETIQATITLLSEFLAGREG
ncbi:ankyrin repeat-containing domain protein [Aspergillus multicolor]|uniref:ankyrin repeat domain-containing protein n=1 Tax=Aspergillus multicolor TaxID=41759 RepID=UPI003CCD5D55